VRLAETRIEEGLNMDADAPTTKVLMVDDEENILRSFGRVLRGEAFALTVTTSAVEALRLLERDAHAVVVSDQRMPEMEGTVFLAKVRELFPDTVRILLTGHGGMDVALEAINRGSVYRFLTKPWNDDELKTVLRAAVSRYELTAENRRLSELTTRQNVELRELNGALEQKVLERTEKINQLNEELKKSFVGTVQVLAGLAEMHSTVLGGHAKRVGALARKLAESIGLTGRDLYVVELAGSLHDIGKIGIPTDIVGKAEDSLLPFEKKIYIRHPLRGEQIVRLISYLGDVPVFIRAHHERFDGLGFPDRLKGEAIPFGARIVAVADAYDKALNARTTYQATTSLKAFHAVEDRQGKNFDPKVVAALSSCLFGTKEDPGEIEISVGELRVGMILARDLRTSHGVPLLRSGVILTEQLLDIVVRHQEIDSLMHGVFVRRAGGILGT
jgi:response regulator RpfG family c-di-GMP phosphodiesterase